MTMTEYDEADKGRIARESDGFAASRFQAPPPQGGLVTLGITAAGLPNDIQTVETIGSPTGGTFLLKGVVGASPWTATLPYNATAAQVLAALTTPYGAPQVATAGGPANLAPVTVTFKGSLLNTTVATMTTDGAGLTGPSAPYEARVNHVASGSAAYPTNPFRVQLVTVSQVESTAIGSAPPYAVTPVYVPASNTTGNVPPIGSRVRLRWYGGVYRFGW